MTDDRIAEIRAMSHQDLAVELRAALIKIARVEGARDRADATIARVEKAVAGLVGFDMLPAMDVRIALRGGKTWDEYERGLDAGRSWHGKVSMGSVPANAPAVVVGGEATPTETPEPIVRVRRINSCCGRAGGCWYWVCAICDDCRSPLMQQSTARQGAASHEEVFHSPAAVPVPAETPETVVGDFPCCASRTTGETTDG